MTEYDNSNKGAIWRNEKKETERHPDFTGSANVEGVEYWVSGWKRDPNGNPKSPALRLSFQAKEQLHKQGMEQASKATQAPTDDGWADDDVPF